MIPTTFVRLNALPLTPNGKIDRRALPAPRGARRDAVAPVTPIERVVADTWAEVLQIPHVGVHDDFFEIGGHSLSAMRVVARLSDVLDIDVSLRMLFDAPTVARLCNQLALSSAKLPDGRESNPRVESRAAIAQRGGPALKPTDENQD
jgi:acyl carrier protein